jgi:hypothetical protein
MVWRMRNVTSLTVFSPAIFLPGVLMGFRRTIGDRDRAKRRERLA